jgi:hypothetical protein
VPRVRDDCCCLRAEGNEAAMRYCYHLRRCSVAISLSLLTVALGVALQGAIFFRKEVRASPSAAAGDPAICRWQSGADSGRDAGRCRAAAPCKEHATSSDATIFLSIRPVFGNCGWMMRREKSLVRRAVRMRLSARETETVCVRSGRRHAGFQVSRPTRGWIRSRAGVQQQRVAADCGRWRPGRLGPRQPQAAMEADRPVGAVCGLCAGGRSYLRVPGRRRAAGDQFLHRGDGAEVWRPAD